MLWTPTAIGDDSTEARDLVRAHVSRVAIRPLPAKVDPALEKAIDRIRDKYNYYEHMNTEAAHADLVPDELVDLFALAGTQAECAKRLKEIESLGVDQVSIVPFVRPGQSREGTIRAFAEIIDERLREEQTTTDERLREEQTTTDERLREEQTVVDGRPA